MYNYLRKHAIGLRGGGRGIVPVDTHHFLLAESKIVSRFVQVIGAGDVADAVRN